MIDTLCPLWIDTADAIAALAEKCRSAAVFALDTEADSMHSYFHKVCLIQVTVAGEHAVIDPLAVSADALSPLWKVCGDPEIQVLMHGADYDIRVLDRDYDASIHGLQDTQIMAMMLGEAKTGLAALLESAFDIHLDKKYQRADWGRRPLTEGMVAYAANDTAHLQALVKVLRGRLEALDRWEWTSEEFRRLERVRHHVVEKDSRAFERVKGVSALKGIARDRAYSLFEWRDSQAQKRNIPPFKILGNASLTAMSLAVPEGPRAMGKVPGLGPRFVQRYGKEVAELLNSPLKAPEYCRPPRQPPVDAGTKKRIARLIEARDAVAERLQIDRAVLCPRALIEAVAELGTGIDDGAFADAGLIGWRREQLAEPFLAVLEA